ncbi:uncharacterized [Tachysurus ichikawai]
MGLRIFEMGNGPTKRGVSLQQEILRVSHSLADTVWQSRTVLMIIQSSGSNDRRGQKVKEKLTQLGWKTGSATGKDERAEKLERPFGDEQNSAAAGSTGMLKIAVNLEVLDPRWPKNQKC